MNKPDCRSVIFTIIITAVLVGGTSYFLWTFSFNQQALEYSSIVAFNCEQSGGGYDDGFCECPVEYDDQLTYDSRTGYCMDHGEGIPGGNVGQMYKDLLKLKMIENQ